VTGPNSRGEIAAASAVETGRPADAGQRAALLVRGGYVITIDPGTGDIPGGDVLVSGGVIAAVGAGGRGTAEVSRRRGRRQAHPATLWRKCC